MLIILFSTNLKAQLNGNYTIGGGPASSTNFTSWASFATVYNSAGVSGNVRVTLMSNQRITSTVQLNQHSAYPTTSTKTLVINGNGYKTTCNFNYEMIFLNSIDYCTIKNLTLIDSASSKAIGIRLASGANDNLIDSCTIIFSGITTASNADNCAYIAISGSNTNLSFLTASPNSLRTTISNNICKTNNLNSPGPAYGIIESQSTFYYNSNPINNSILNNSISNFYNTGIYLLSTNGFVVKYNKLTRNDATVNSAIDSLNFTPIRLVKSYESTRLAQINNNIIENIPFAGATGFTAGNYIYKFYGINLVYGNSGFFNSAKRYPLECNENIFQKINFKYICCAIYPNFCGNIKVRKNLITHITGGQSANLIYCQSNNGATEVTENTFKLNNFGSSNGLVNFVCLTNNSQNLGDSSWAIGNVIDSNIIGSGSMGIFSNLDRATILRNRVSTFEFQKGSTDFTAIKSNSGNSYINGNLIIGNGGVGLFTGISHTSTTTYRLEITQNTIYFKSTDTANFIGITTAFNPNKLIGNIIYGIGNNNGTFISISNPSSKYVVDRNMYFGNFNLVKWSYMSNNYSFSQWKTLSIVGINDKFENPKFLNVKQNNFTPVNANCQNKFPFIAYGNLDVWGNNRNKPFADIGAIESNFDFKLQNYTYSSNINFCAGIEYGPLTILGKSNFNDTLTQVTLAFSVNNGAEIVETLNRKINPFDTFSYSFIKFPNIKLIGNNKIRAYLKLNDDSLKNDTIIFNVFANPAPSGSKITLIDSSNQQNKTINSSKFYVTAPGILTKFSVGPPNLLLNSEFGVTKKWTISATLQSTYGKPIKSNINIIPPSGSNHAVVDLLLTDSSFQDSIIEEKIKISNLISGCDTTYILKMYVLPLPDIKLKASRNNVCASDTIYVNHNGLDYRDQLRYHWDFGTGMSADTSNEFFPQKSYKTAGNYKITLSVYHPKYPFIFQSFDSVKVQIKPILKFTKVNVCPLEKLNIRNFSTPKTAQMFWDFGDGKGYNQIQDSIFFISLKNGGNYVFTLKANNYGCITTTSQNVNIFYPPIASFSKQFGNCYNEQITYQNNSTVKEGNLYYKWELGENNVLNFSKNPTYKYSTSGYKNVKLTVRTDFGCADSITKSIYIKPAPLASFKSTDYCIIRPTQFTNTTPKIPGSVASYFWDFGNGDVSYTENVNQSWNTLGLKTVKFKVSLDNGCWDTTQMLIYVLDEGTPKYTVQTKCSNDTCKFTNLSSNSTGGIMLYKWYFGDGDSSEKENPIHVYKNRYDKNFSVSLICKIPNGCATPLTKNILINGFPKTCEFEGSPDYAYAFYGMKFEPKDDNGLIGGENGVNYIWTRNSKDTQLSSNLSAMVHYIYPKDTFFNIKMTAVQSASGCQCSSSKTIIMNRAESENILTNQIEIFPNPAQNNVTIQSFNNIQITEIKLFNSIGQLVLCNKSILNNIAYIQLNNLSKGVYNLSIYSTNGVFNKLIMKE